MLPTLLSSLIDETVDLNTDQCEKIWADYEQKISVEACEKLEEATRSHLSVRCGINIVKEG